MKFILSILFLSALSVASAAQDRNNRAKWYIDTFGHSRHDFAIYGSPNLLFHSNNNDQFALGIKARMYIGKKISFETDLLLGRNYFHFGPGIIGLPIWYFFLNNSPVGNDFEDENGGSLQDLLINAMIMCLSAERISYHIDAGRTAEISPYISLLRLRSSPEPGIVIDSEEYSASQLSFALGIGYDAYFSKFLLTPYIEYNRTYDGSLSDFFTGIYFGLYFPSR